MSVLREHNFNHKKGILRFVSVPLFLLHLQMICYRVQNHTTSLSYHQTTLQTIHPSSIKLLMNERKRRIATLVYLLEELESAIGLCQDAWVFFPYLSLVCAIITKFYHGYEHYYFKMFVTLFWTKLGTKTKRRSFMQYTRITSY